MWCKTMTKTFASRHSASLFPSGLAMRLILLSGVACSPLSQVSAQSASTKAEIPNPPDFRLVDENYVNVGSLLTEVSVPLVSIGGADGLSETLSNDPSGYNDWSGLSPGSVLPVDRYMRSGFYPGRLLNFSFQDGVSLQSSPIGQSWTFSFRGASERFSGWSITPSAVSMSKTGGAVVSQNGVSSYVDRKGVIHELGGVPTGSLNASVSKLTKPNGEVIRIYYRTSKTPYRIQAVTSSRGWYLRYVYSDNTNQAQPYTTGALHPMKIVAANSAYEYCAPEAETCQLSLSWPEARLEWSSDYRTFTVRDSTGRTTRFNLNAYREIASIQEPGFVSPNLQFVHCQRTTGDGGDNCERMQQAAFGYTNLTFIGMTSRTIRDGITTSYDFLSGAGGYYNYQNATNPYYGGRSVTSNADPYNFSKQGAYLVYNKVGRSPSSISFAGDPTNRVLSASFGGSSGFEFTYDERGNTLTEKQTPVPATTGPALIRAWDYPAVCVNQVTCNLPASYRDARGNQTDYTYDPVHGGLLAKILPPDSAGVRPQTRYEYVQRYPWLLDAAGSYVRAEQPIWVISRERTCRTSATVGAACSAGPTDEVVTTYGYGPDAGPNNLLVREVTVQADGITRRTCYAYDRFGNRISEISPRAGVTQCW